MVLSVQNKFVWVFNFNFTYFYFTYLLKVLIYPDFVWNAYLPTYNSVHTEIDNNLY